MVKEILNSFSFALTIFGPKVINYLVIFIKYHIWTRYLNDKYIILCSLRLDSGENPLAISAATSLLLPSDSSLLSHRRQIWRRDCGNRGKCIVCNTNIIWLSIVFVLARFSVRWLWYQLLQLDLSWSMAASRLYLMCLSGQAKFEKWSLRWRNSEGLMQGIRSFVSLCHVSTTILLTHFAKICLVEDGYWRLLFCSPFA